MKEPTFVDSILKVTASGVDVSKDLAREDGHSISSLLEEYNEEKEKETE